MRLTGAGIWGEPDDPAECRRVLRRAVELGINLVDTAASYGPEGNEGKVAHIGLSNVSVAELELGLTMTEIVTVQNRYNLTDRASEDVLGACTDRGIGFIPWFPLATGSLARPGGLLDDAARRHDP